MVPEIGTGGMRVGTIEGIDAVAGEERTGFPKGMRQHTFCIIMHVI